jgi:type IV secretion system protein TrbL
MTTFDLDTIGNQFYAAAQNYSTAIRPYALDLFFSLFLIDIVVTYVQYTADQLDPMHYLGRTIRHLMGGGFVYMMILYGFTWMGIVIASFGRLGGILTGLPPLSPQSILGAGREMFSVLWNSPTTSGIISSVELGILEGFMAIVVLAAFVLVALELLLTLVRGYFVIGVGVIMLSFGGNRFTANVSESYFTSVIRVGIKILFIYAVLGVGMSVVNNLTTALLAVCHPASTTVPWITSYWTPPTAIVTTVCTGTITLGDMADYAVIAVVFAALCVGIPRMAAELVGGPLGHALEDLAAAYFVGRSVLSPIGSAARAAGGAITGAASDLRSNFGGRGATETGMQNFAAQVAAQARARSGGQPTAPLNPFNGQPPGYNMRPPAGPPISPPPGGGSGNSGLGLEYYPGRPGAKTRAEAVDITKLQKNQ